MSAPSHLLTPGIYTAIFSPINLSGDVDLKLFAQYLNFQREAGTTGVAVTGTNGEGVSLAVDERKKILEQALSIREDLVIIAGTGSSSITDAIDLTRHAAGCGAAAALVLPPFFFKTPDPNGIADYFKRVLDSADIPVLLYNIPQFTAVPITDEIIDLLDNHPNLAGVKDSAGDWNRTQEFIKNHPGLKIYSGSDRLLANALIEGSAGCISGGANAYPELFSSVWRAWQSDPTGSAAKSAQKPLDAVIDITVRYPFITSGKALVSHRGLQRLGVRPPLVPLSEELEAQMITELKSSGLLENLN